MKAVCLISGGIDSPVAAKLMIDKGVEVVFLHGTIKNKNNKIKKIVSTIKPNSELFFINHKKFLEKAKGNKYTCVLCKRHLYKEAEKLCNKIEAEFIITGESIGQVASQTLDNLRVLDEAVKIPVIRPLIGLNKQEIINIAEEIGTYKLSIVDNSVCPFVPNKPATKSDIKKILVEESKI